MTEWAVVGVLIALIGMIATIVAPIIKLNTTITKLTTVVDIVQNTLKTLTSDNSESHRRLWQHNNEQDDKIVDHDKRIHLLEGK